MWQTPATRDKLAIWITVSQRYRAQKSMTISHRRPSANCHLHVSFLCRHTKCMVDKAGCTLPMFIRRTGLAQKDISKDMKEMKNAYVTPVSWCLLISASSPLSHLPLLLCSASALFSPVSLCCSAWVKVCERWNICCVIKTAFSLANCILFFCLIFFSLSYGNILSWRRSE